MEINGYTRLATVVAHPIKHSISPFIHNFAFERLGINGVYLAWDIELEDLAETVANIRRYDMWGINLSMPYKAAVIPYLDQLGPEVALTGAVNTVVNQDGQLVGRNTDGIGFFKHLEKAYAFQVADKEILLFGAGGAGTAILAQAALDGAKHIHLFVRQASLEKVSAKVDKIVQATGCAISLAAMEDRDQVQAALQQADLLVNASSLGMDGLSSPLADDLVLPENLLVADVIYQPFETPLLKRARQEGLEATNGLGMLLYQAAQAFYYWTGQEMPTDAIWQALEEKFRV